LKETEEPRKESLITVYTVPHANIGYPT